MAKIGRNQPCPCGCGRKFKVCLGERRDRIVEFDRVADAERAKDARRAMDKIRLTAAILAAHAFK